MNRRLIITRDHEFRKKAPKFEITKFVDKKCENVGIRADCRRLHVEIQRFYVGFPTFSHIFKTNFSAVKFSSSVPTLPDSSRVSGPGGSPILVAAWQVFFYV